MRRTACSHLFMIPCLYGEDRKKMVSVALPPLHISTETCRVPQELWLEKKTEFSWSSLGDLGEVRAISLPVFILGKEDKWVQGAVSIKVCECGSVVGSLRLLLLELSRTVDTLRYNLENQKVSERESACQQVQPISSLTSAVVNWWWGSVVLASFCRGRNFGTENLLVQEHSFNKLGLASHFSL